MMAIACAAGAQAFVPPSAFSGSALTRTAKTSSSMKMSYEKEIGAQPPLGFWDPLGLVEDVDQEQFDYLRLAEVKHGRIAMIAVLGHITAQNVRFPGLLSSSENLAFADMPNGLGALAKIPPAGILQILLFIFFMEVGVMKQVEGSFPGDMTYGGQNPWAKQWAKMSPEQQAKKRSIELNNGRAAQMGIFGLVVHESINGHPYVINDLLGMSYNFP